MRDRSRPKSGRPVRTATIFPSRITGVVTRSARLIPSNHTAGTVERKYANKGALRDRLRCGRTTSLSSPTSAASTTRKASASSSTPSSTPLAQGAQLVLLGSSPSPDPAVNARFWHLKHQLHDNSDCHLEIGFEEGLAHLIYAGADLLVMPGLFEPCGLSQLIALKYGTVPVVRASGGLVDTVFDRDYSARAAAAEPEAEAGLGRPRCARRPGGAASGAATDESVGDAGHAAALGRVVHRGIRRRAVQREDRGGEDPAAQPESERPCLEVGAHSPGRGHAPDADRRAAAPVHGPG
jgi:hypothetical protein